MWIEYLELYTVSEGKLLISYFLNSCVMLSEEALMNIPSVFIFICHICSTAQLPIPRTDKSGRDLLQTPAPQNICPKQPDVLVHLVTDRECLFFWVRLLSIRPYTMEREIIYIFLSDLLIKNTKMTAHLETEMVLDLVPINVFHLGYLSSLHIAWEGLTICGSWECELKS